MAIRCNGENIPITLYFQDKYGRKTPVQTMWNHSSRIDRNNLAVINENMQVGIVFSVDNDNDYDPDANLTIQTSVFNESGIQKEEYCPLQVGGNSINWLYEDRSNEEFPWRMGIYHIEIHYRREKYISGLFVKPLHLSMEQVFSMHDYLEKQIEGIIYDYIYSNRTSSAPLNHSKTSYWYYDYARYIKEIQDEFMYLMTMISKSPIESVLGGYQIENSPKKIDRKSIQWGMGRKGMSKNAGLMIPQYYMNRKKFSVYQTRENEWIKNILIEWKYNIGLVKELLNKDYQKLLLEEKLKIQEFEIHQAVQRSLIGKMDVAISTKKDIASKILMTQKDLNEMERMHNAFDGWFEALSSFESKISYFTNETFLLEVRRGNRKPLLKKANYFRVDKMYEESLKIKKDEGDKERYISILKPTWQIYEYFCLFESMEALRSNGFNLTSGIDETFLNAYKQDRIPEGSKFVMENDRFQVHIWYDKYHAHSLDEAKGKNENFYIHNVKKRPDIKMDLYEKKENGILYFHNCLVMDAKFRKLANIHNRDYINSTTEQLTGYTSFFYCGESPTRASKYAPCVNRVICLYANNEENEAMKLIAPITYIKLFPDFKADGEQYVMGSRELSKTIREWIDSI